MTEYKIITQTVSADTTLLTFTDELITNNSLIDFYYTDNTVYTESVSQSGTSVYLTISEHTNTVGVACVINNVTSYAPFDDTEIQNALSELGASIQTIENDITTIDGILSDHTSVLTSHSSEIVNLQNSKQDELTAGENITIENNVISASGGGSGINYSTEEQNTGVKWVDGSYIYQKSYIREGSVSSSGTTIDTIGNFKELINTELVSMNSSRTTWLSTSSSSNSYSMRIEVSTNGTVQLRGDTTWSNPKVNCTIYYTKVGD